MTDAPKPEEVEAMATRLIKAASAELDGYTFSKEAAAMLRSLQATLTAERARAEKMREALKPFAAIAPSSFYPADGSENEGYSLVLSDTASRPTVTGAELAAARAAYFSDSP